MPSPPGELLRDDRPVVVPPQLAGEVLRLLAKALLLEAREHGAAGITPSARQLLTALHDASTRAPNPSSAGGTTAPAKVTVEWVTVLQAAKILGCTTRWVRKLLSSQRLAARRVGRMWLIDAASLDRFRFRRDDVA